MFFAALSEVHWELEQDPQDGFVSITGLLGSGDS
jgi:hypothetical protein